MRMKTNEVNMIRARQRAGKKPIRGFTMTELLVVISIILLLAALIAPMIGRAIENGRRAACRTNLRQIGAAFFSFANDHNGWLPIVMPIDGVTFDLNSRTTLPQKHDGSTLYLQDQWPFDNHVRLMAETGYVTTPRKFWCPSDKVTGAGAERGRGDPVFPVSSFENFESSVNCSYMYVAGYNLVSWPVQHSIAPVLADESNRIERGDLTPGQMPRFTQYDNHGANFRNVLWLDGRVTGEEDPDVGNSIFNGLDHRINPNVPADITEKLNSID